MTEEAEKAAKWEIVETYQAAKGKLATLESHCKEIGSVLVTIGHAISDCPEKVAISSDTITYPQYAGAGAYERNKDARVTIPLAELSHDRLKALIDEYGETLQEKTDALEHLKALGLHPEAL